MRVSLFITCFNDTLFPETGRAVVHLLERLGHTVDFPEEQTCCGQMHYNTGYQREALPLIRRFVQVFGSSEVVYSDHEWPEILKRANRLEVKGQQAHSDEGDKRESNLQIGIGHHGVAILFEIESFGIMEARVVIHERSPSRIPTEDPPDVPLKMWFASAGIFRSA